MHLVLRHFCELLQTVQCVLLHNPSLTGWGSVTKICDQYLYLKCFFSSLLKTGHMGDQFIVRDHTDIQDAVKDLNKICWADFHVGLSICVDQAWQLRSDLPGLAAIKRSKLNFYSQNNLILFVINSSAHVAAKHLNVCEGACCRERVCCELEEYLVWFVWNEELLRQLCWCVDWYFFGAAR